MYKKTKRANQVPILSESSSPRKGFCCRNEEKKRVFHQNSARRKLRAERIVRGVYAILATGFTVRFRGRGTGVSPSPAAFFARGARFGFGSSTGEAFIEIASFDGSRRKESMVGMTCQGVGSDGTGAIFETGTRTSFALVVVWISVRSSEKLMKRLSRPKRAVSRSDSNDSPLNASATVLFAPNFPYGVWASG